MSELLLAPAYLGNVTGRNSIASNDNQVNKQMNALKYFPLRDDVTGVQIVYSSSMGIVGSPTFGEKHLGGSATITAAVGDLKSSTRIQARFAGAVQGALQSAVLLVSELAPASGRRGQFMPVWTYWDSPVGIVWHNKEGTPQDRIEFGISGLADKTMGGTIGNAFPTSAFGPIAIIAQTRKGSVLIWGDSLCQDTLYGVPSDLNGEMGILARLIGPDAAYCNFGVGNDRIDYCRLAANSLVRTQLMPYFSHAILGNGNNDLGSGITPAVMKASAEEWAARFPDHIKLAMTVTPRVDATDPATLAGQTTISAFNTPRLTWNNSHVRNGSLVGFHNHIDMADILESDRDSGIFAVGNIPGQTSGATIIADAGSPRTHVNAAGLQRIQRYRNIGRYSPEMFAR